MQHCFDFNSFLPQINLGRSFKPQPFDFNTKSYDMIIKVLENENGVEISPDSNNPLVINFSKFAQKIYLRFGYGTGEPINVNIYESTSKSFSKQFLPIVGQYFLEVIIEGKDINKIDMSAGSEEILISICIEAK